MLFVRCFSLSCDNLQSLPHVRWLDLGIERRFNSLIFSTLLRILLNALCSYIYFLWAISEMREYFDLFFAGKIYTWVGRNKLYRPREYFYSLRNIKKWRNRISLSFVSLNKCLRKSSRAYDSAASGFLHYRFHHFACHSLSSVDLRAIWWSRTEGMHCHLSKIECASSLKFLILSIRNVTEWETS